MYRRFVSLLLLPCLLLAQSAAVGHAHAGSTPAGHDLRPHFHTRSLSVEGEHPGHDHTHGHSHGDHHHSHPGQEHSPGLSAESVPPLGPESDHDSSAVFTAGVDFVVDQRPAVDTGSGLWPTAWVDLPLTFLAASRRVAASHLTHPPPGPHGSCPIYVRHLTLLI